MRALAFVASLAIATPAPAGGISLGLPVSCDLGKTCWVQQYADDDPSPGVSDHACGSQSYDGHDGTDIRVLDTSVIADVVAAAPGIVRALRDGEEDHLIRTEEERKSVADRECGNGVLIAHDSGWETQYCHLKRGSVAVKKGDRVAAGARLGRVGYSGLAAFPHVHLSVRRDGVAVDPFQPEGAQACDSGGPALWNEEAAAALTYQDGSILRTGFAPAAVTPAELESGAVTDALPDRTWPALVAYGWAINLAAEDEVFIALDGPEDFDAQHHEVLARRKAQYLVFVGKKAPRTGSYKASFRVVRHGKIVLQRNWTVALN